MRLAALTSGLTFARALVAALVVTVACTHDKSGDKGTALKAHDRSGATAPGSEAQPTPTGAVLLRASGRSVRVQVEVVRTPEARARGLMFRRELAADAGMLFIFDQQEIQSFWMKNTYLPLDMIFIDDELRVVGVVHDAEPLTTTSRSVDRPSRYVLEVNAGFAKRRGIATGTAVSFEGI